MKLSMWSSYYVDLSPEEAMLELAKYDFHYTELSDEHGAVLLERGPAEKVGAEFGRFARENGVDPLQGHLWLKVPLCDPDEENVVSVLKTWLDLFCAAGIKTGVLHCDSRSFPEATSTEAKAAANAKVLQRLLDHLRGTDFTICLENLYVPAGMTPVVDTLDQILNVIHQTSGNNLGICLDTGHLMVTKGDQADFIHRAGGLLKALHLANNDGAWDQHLMPFSRSAADFVEITRAMKDIGYDGLWNLEIPGERLCPLEIRGYKLEYLNKMFRWLDQNA